MQRITTDGRRFLDDTGRERIFHGINMVFKGEVNPRTGKKEYIPGWDDGTFRWLASNGFNLIRLGIIWDAVEPEPGSYDEMYLGWVDRIISICRKHSIYVFLDMHQDLFSEKYSDGAPAWATLDEGLGHYEGELWSDSYLFSDAVKRAFDNFWANGRLPTGEGIQDHYAKMWGMLARRYSKHCNIIGFDVMNEPFPGTPGARVFVTLLGAFARLTGRDMGPEELMGLFTDEASKMELLAEIDDYGLYSAMASAAASEAAGFEDEVLDSFYKKVSSEINKSSGDCAFFIENSYFSNMGIPSAVKRPSDDGSFVYAPHGYDLVVDSPAVCMASNKRVDVIFDNHRKVQERLGIPVIVGEWGAHSMYSEGLDHIRHILGKFDGFKWSNTYWSYFAGCEKAPVMEALRRPHPVAAAGRIKDYSFDYTDRRFTLSWDRGFDGVTVVYLPGNPMQIKTSLEYSVRPVDGQCGACLVEIKGGASEHGELTVSL